jgi:hypothetical protein
MIGNLMELLALAGLEDLKDLQPEHINRRVSGTVVRTYQQLYPHITSNCLLDSESMPEAWKEHWQKASADKW